ncbi:MAG: accessory factor UbiK family protein [Pseudomonadota bacterium]
MALKPPPLGEVIQQVNELVDSSSIREEVDKNARALAQSALSRLDLVGREEFNIQADLLHRMQQRGTVLEAQLESLNLALERLYSPIV